LLALLKTSSSCGAALREPTILAGCPVLGISRIHAFHAEPNLARNSDGESDLGTAEDMRIVVVRHERPSEE
jgi:hypothetical protein